MLQRRILLLLFLSLGFTGVKAETGSDTLLVRLLRNEGVEFSNDNSLTVFNRAKDKYADMFRAISQARESIHLEYFNFRNDSIAGALFDLLARKAREGVEVRALFDAFGNASNNRPLRRQHLEKLRESGIEIYEFDPLRFPWLNHVFHRDHRKIVVIDGQMAYIGGMNVADYYIHGTEKIGSWHDMHCRLEGSSVNELQRIFLRIWNRTAGEKVSGAKYYRRFPYADYITGLKKDTTATSGHKMIGIINREPHRTNRIMRRFYCGAIDSAKDSIRLLNPYLTLTHSVKKALRRALRRGVKVEIMISEKCDIPLSPDLSFYNLYKLAQRGARVYIYQGGFHHTKTIMVDGRFCTIGSCNLDARSLNWDYEANAVIMDRNTTAELTRLFDKDKEESFILTEEKYKTWLPKSRRILGRIAKLLATWL